MSNDPPCPNGLTESAQIYNKMNNLPNLFVKKCKIRCVVRYVTVRILFFETNTSEIMEFTKTIIEYRMNRLNGY